jgi:uncharacterized protein DUF4190
MSDDDLWRPQDPADGSSGESPSAAVPDAAGVSDETQPITGASSTPPPSPPPSPPSPPSPPAYESSSGPGAVPPPQNPYGQATPPTQQAPYGGQPASPYGQQQNPYGGQPYPPPPNPYAAPNEYATPQNPYGSPYQPAYAGGALSDHPSATTAMVLGIIGLVGILLCGGITLVLSPAAWVVGAKAVREIDASPGRYGGRDRAQAGKIMGIIGTVLLVLAVVAVIGVIALAVSVGSGDPTPVNPTVTFQNG